MEDELINKLFAEELKVEAKRIYESIYKMYSDNVKTNLNFYELIENMIDSKYKLFYQLSKNMLLD